jgi:hypothetical protein
VADAPLSARLPGTWRPLSRTDIAPSGLPLPDPALGSNPVALLICDRAGKLSAQFMKRDRSTVPAAGTAGAKSNTRAQGGYDAYFGTCSVDDATGVATQRLLGVLSSANVGAVLSRAMTVQGETLDIELDTTVWDGTPVVRTLTWERVG